MSTKRFTLIVATLLLIFAIKSEMVSGQTLLSLSSPNSTEDWFEMMQDPNANFYEVQSAFYKAFEGRTDLKGTGYKIFKRWEYINEPRVLPDGKLQAPDYVKNQYFKYMKEAEATKSAAGNWTVVGPTAYPVNNTSQPTGMGRINAIAFHPTNAEIIFVGAPSGGFWKTIDGGSNWTNFSSDLPTLGISCILVDPIDPDIIYLGTGDRDSDDAPGIGVYKTTDGGATWVQMTNTMGNVVVNAMVMHPSDPEIILAATSTGIYKTINGGTNWVSKLAPGNFKEILFKPDDPTIVYATYSSSSIGARFYRSANTGENWNQITSGILNAGTAAAGARMVMAVAPSAPSYVYLLQIVESTKVFQGLLRSTDSGLNFSTRSTSPNIMDYACDGSGTASQATYDLCITVEPSNANTIYVGSINNWKSTDGGVNWGIVSHWSNDCSIGISELHADQHCYEWNDGKLYVGHDGGISYTANNGGSWTEITNNLTISQIYKIGQGALNTDYTLIGCQDNGSAATTDGSTFTTTRGGDGTECIIDYSNSNYCYNTYIKGDIDRSTTGPTGSYTEIAATGVNGIGSGEIGAWVTPYMLHETNASIMFAGYMNVYRCDDVKVSPASSVSWSAISTGETNPCSVLEQSPANVDIIYVVRPNYWTGTEWLTGNFKRTDNANATAASVTWTACTLPGGEYPTDLEAHPTDANIIYATVDYGVYKSEDKGANWTEITGNLPALFTNCLVYDKNSNEGIYVGNQTAVWYKDADMTDWVLFSVGLPPVDIRELEIYYDAGTPSNNRIKAATYGRGLWESDLIEITSYSPKTLEAIEASPSQISLSWTKNTANEDVIVAWSSSSVFGTPTDGNSYDAGISLSGGGTILYKGSATSYKHTNLSSNSRYYYKAWSVNSSIEYSIGVTNDATTFCSLITSFPWNEGFENSGNSPSCWTQENIVQSLNWVFRAGSSNGSPTTAHTGSFNANLATLTYNWPVTKLISPPINLTAISNPVLKFWHTQEYWYPDQDELRVYYRTSASGTWILLEEYTTSIASWTERTINLPAASSSYFIAFEGIANAGFGVCIDDVEISGTAQPFWTGATSSDWNTSENWLNGTVPIGSSDVIISDVSTKPVVNEAAGSPALCNNLTIQPGGSLNINPGKALTVNGTLTNSAGTSGLVIKSDATGTGSLIHSTTDVDATFERFMNNADWTNWQDGWHFLSSPVASQAIDPEFTTVPYDFYCWYEPENMWVNYKNTTEAPTWNTANGSTNFILGKGYMAAYDAEDTKQFAGKLNTEDVDISGLTVPGAGANKSWHLLGNPFGSALTWDASGAWNLYNIGGAIKIWNESNQSYSDLSSDPASVIPATNGFFVQVTTDPGSLTIPAIKRVHSTVPFYKNTVPGLMFKAISLSEGNAQESRVIINPEASTDYDLMYDCEFLAGYAPQFYSIAEGEKLSTNSITEISEQTEIMFGFVKNSGSDFRIEASGTETLHAKAYLHDLKTGVITNLNENPVYEFASDEGDTPARFKLRFGIVGINDPTEKQTISAWYAGDNLCVSAGNGITNVGIFNIQGQKLYQLHMQGSGIHRTAINLSTGVYFARIVNGGNMQTVKIIIQ